MPTINVGGNAMTAQFASLDFAEIVLNQQNKHTNQQEIDRRNALVDSGALSVYDLSAPPKAISEFNEATTLLRGRHSQEAIEYLQKAVALYPKFVAAHNYLGLAYQDAEAAAPQATPPPLC